MSLQVPYRGVVLRLYAFAKNIFPDNLVLSCCCCCNPFLVTTFPEWLSGTEPWPRTPGAMRPSSCLCCVFAFTCTVCRLIRWTPQPMFSDTVIADRHSDTTIFQPRAQWVRISWSIGSEKIVRTYATGGSRTRVFLRERRTPYPLGKARCICLLNDVEFEALFSKRCIIDKEGREH